MAQPVCASSPSASIDFVDVRFDRAFGNSAFASRDIQCGETVLAEDPLLCLTPLSLLVRLEDSSFSSGAPSSSPAQLSLVQPAKDAEEFIGCVLTAARTLRVDVRFFDVIASIVLQNVSSTLVELLESDLYAPDIVFPKGERDAAHAILTTDQWFDGVFPRWCNSRSFWEAVRSASPSPNDKGRTRLLRLIHACRINVHEANGRSFVFKKASKFAHSCNANTFWTAEEQLPYPRRGSLQHVTLIRAVHIANRFISKGELLTFSYIGTGWNMLQPTLLRRERLSELNFICGCDRCNEYDAGRETCRRLRCPQCKAAARQLKHHNHRATVACSASQGGWRCILCDASFQKEEFVAKQLFAERALSMIVMRLFFSKSTVSDVSDAADINEGGGCACEDQQWSLVVAHSTFHDVLTRLPPQGGPLLPRWEVPWLCNRAFGEEHYLFAVSFSSLVQCILRALLAVRSDRATSDWERFLAAKRSVADDSTTPTAVIVPWYEEWITGYHSVHRWYRANLPGSVQEAKTLLMFADVMGMLLGTPTLAMSSNVAVRRTLLPNELEALAAFWMQIATSSDDSPRTRFEGLLQHPDFVTASARGS